MQEGEEGLAGQQRVTMVMRNGRWMGARGANTAGTGASHDQQMTEQRLMEGLAGVPGLQQGLQRVQARVSVFSEDTESACALKPTFALQGVPGLQGFDMGGSGRSSGMTRWNHKNE